MFGKNIGTLIFATFITWVFLLLFFFFQHKNIQASINQINYSVCEVIATTGCLKQHTYNYLYDQISKYGDFTIILKLEKRIKPNIYDTFFDEADIINKKLRIGDIVTIAIEQKNTDVFSKILNIPSMPFVGGKEVIDVRYSSIKNAFIANDAEDIVKGYDVICDIQNNVSKGNTRVFVCTKLNVHGKTYNNEIYGDTGDETSQTGINHIFEHGDFLKEVEITPGNITILKYYQE